MAVVVPQEIQRFLTDQVAQGEMDVQDILYYLEKPWKWDKEFQAWKEHQAEGERIGRVFACDPDESGGLRGFTENREEGWVSYDISDPKHPDFHSIHADIWDSREGK